MKNLYGSRQFKIYIDLDNTLTDFNEAVEKLGPDAVEGLNDNAMPEVKQVMYDAIEKAGDAFWANMPWMSDGKQLWAWLSQFNPVLLTSPGKFQFAVSGKVKWVKKNIPGTSIFFEEEKWRYAERSAILIDDNEEKIEAWRSKGGIGILHKDFKSTKNDLLLAIKSISPNRANNLITFETLQDIHKSLMAKKVLAGYKNLF